MPPIIYSDTSAHLTTIKNTKFTHSLDSAIRLTSFNCYPYRNSTGDTGSEGTFLKNMKITYDSFKWENGDHRAFYTDGCGSIIIAGCTFSGCSSVNPKSWGGSIMITQNVSVKIHETIFDNSTTNSQRGAAAAIAASIKLANVNGHPDEVDHDDQIISLDVQYCCFQECYGTHNNLFGVALFSAAINTTLLYASTTNCPGYHKAARGAQFDLQANEISSKYVNTSGGNSLYCCGIEYRYEKYGFFKFQTTFNNSGQFSNSFTDIDITNLTLSHSNYLYNTLRSGEGDSLPSLVLVQRKSVTINYFYFFENKKTDNRGVIVARGSNNKLDINVIIDLHNCFTDKGEDWLVKDNYFHRNDLQINQPFQTADIVLLKLGSCEGQITPDVLIVSSIFTPSKVFSNSNAFSSSKDFSNSQYFTQTDKFSYSSMFSQSTDFSKSSYFTLSDKFTQSKGFSKSSFFSGTFQFSKSDFFTKSNMFSKTEKFSQSAKFTESTKFTQSDIFKPSAKFTQSEKFTCSTQFSESAKFTQSTKFTQTAKFTQSTKFTQSYQFSTSNEFTHSFGFNPTERFTKSKMFSKSGDFTSTQLFTKTGLFSLSSDFTRSTMFSHSFFFTNSLKFSQSERFSKTAYFSKSTVFTLTQKFTESTKFTNSGKFTPSNNFNSSATFTPSKTFSYSNYFTFSSKFSKSFEFSKSNDFSKTSMFKKSDQFTKSSFFSNSGYFSGSDEFTKALIISSSFYFSNSKEFSKSKAFSKSDIFPSSVPFKPTSAFHPTNVFSSSEKFTKSFDFTQSWKFSDSNDFTNSNNLFKSTKRVIIDIKADVSSKDGQINVGIVAGSAIAIAALIGCIILVALLLNRRRKGNNDINSEPETVNVLDSNTNPNVIDNPLYTMNELDDPFQSDFDEIM